jgi:hypothetical protein
MSLRGFRSGRVWIAVVAALIVPTISGHVAAAGLPPGSAPSGTIMMRPTTGERNQSFDLLLPSGAVCPTDAVAWQTFIVPLTADASQLRYSVGVPSIDSSTDRIRALISGGTRIVDQPLGSGGTIPISTYFQFSPFPAGVFTDGPYRLGVACTDLGGVTVRYWQTTLGLETDSLGIARWARYGTPSAPILGAPRLGVPGTFQASITVEPTVPPISSIVVTAVSTNGGVPGSIVIDDLTSGSRDIAVDGLSNGYQYQLQAVASNAQGDSPPSSLLTATVYDIADVVAVDDLAVSADAGTATLTWTAPTGVTPLSYTITVSPTMPGSPFSTTATTITISGIPSGVVAFTVTPVVAPPYVGAPITVSYVPDGPGQTVTATRPPGFLSLTQTCGRFGALPAEPESPGFPALPAMPATGVGTAPSLDPAGATPDPGFPQYPTPTNGAGGGPVYPTYCALDLGPARLITDGREAGKYFAIAGRLNQVTVVDTRPIDAGWTVAMSVSDFVGDSGLFSGGYLGWSPATSTNGEQAYDGYQQVVTPGGVVLPDPERPPGARVLARADAGSGLGWAMIDARLKVLIPLAVDAGTYRATVTITVV